LQANTPELLVVAIALGLGCQLVIAVSNVPLLLQQAAGSRGFGPEPPQICCFCNVRRCLLIAQSDRRHLVGIADRALCAQIGCGSVIEQVIGCSLNRRVPLVGLPPCPNRVVRAPARRRALGRRRGLLGRRRGLLGGRGMLVVNALLGAASGRAHRLGNRLNLLRCEALVLQLLNFRLVELVARDMLLSPLQRLLLIGRRRGLLGRRGRLLGGRRRLLGRRRRLLGGRSRLLGSLSLL
jgi:hypothetical protein